MDEPANQSDTIVRIEFTESGNSGPYQRGGWSYAETTHTWATGDSAGLVVPLPAGEHRLRLDFSLMPFTHPSGPKQQRLSIEINDRRLRELVLDRQDLLSVEIDASQLADPGTLRLKFNQPDAASPLALDVSSDARVLGFGFHWLRVRRIERFGGSPFEPQTLSAVRTIAPASASSRVIVLGDIQAREVQEIAARLPCLERAFAFTWLNPKHADFGVRAAALRDTAKLAAIWCQVDRGEPALPFLQEVPDGVPVVTFPRLTMPILWPFQGADPRRVPEPAYPQGRYVFGDTVAAGLADASGSDDALFAEYLRRSAELCPDTDAAMSAYAAMLAEADARCTVGVADFILDRFTEVKLFHNDKDPAGVLLRHVALLAIIKSGLHGGPGLATVLREVSALTQGYQGLFQSQVPINPIVAQRYGVRWCDPEMRYRYGYNKLTFRDYILQYIRWRPWCF
ncbi:MAG: hypothetical protein JO264_16380 [Acidisphaera sp.]|nr:hypothetical protein [Acidisphaera sp.]